jgi:hypothetical protein
MGASQGLRSTTELMSELESRRTFLENRAGFPVEALIPYAGHWIAWSPDGTKIVAHSQTPVDLDDRIRAAGEDPARCVVEGIPEGEAMLGGEGLGPIGS